MAAAEEAALRPSYNGLNFLEMPDAKYWSGADQPWRNGTDDSPITDEAIIAREEEVRKRAAEQDDAAAVRVPWWWWPCGERSEAEPRKSIYEARKGHKRQFGEQKWEARYRPTVSFSLMHMWTCRQHFV